MNMKSWEALLQMCFAGVFAVLAALKPWPFIAAFAGFSCGICFCSFLFSVIDGKES